MMEDLLPGIFLNFPRQEIFHPFCFQRVYRVRNFSLSFSLSVYMHKLKQDLQQIPSQFFAWQRRLSVSSRGIFAVFPNLRGGLPSKEKKKSKKGKEGRLARTMMNVTKFVIEGGKVSLPSLPRPPFFHSFFHPVITTMNQPLIPITTLFLFPPNFHQFLNSSNKITIIIIIIKF